MERLLNHQTIDEFLLDITESAEYKRIEYLIFSIRMNYLHYMAISRIVKFEIPKYLENLIGIVIDKFNESGISCIFRKNRALAPHERSAVPLGTDHCPVG